MFLAGDVSVEQAEVAAAQHPALAGHAKKGMQTGGNPEKNCK